MNSRGPVLAVAAVVCAAAVLYSARLDRVPSYLSTDETAFALQAHAIATTAHDEHGRLLPLYFQMVENVWFHPALVYAMAPVLTVVPPLPWAVRLPTVVVALCNILLVYVLARRLGASAAASVGAAALLTLTPAHVMHGRLACDYLFPVPCVLAWFVLLVGGMTRPSPWRLAAAGGVLGLGMYTYIAALVVMPVCLLLTYGVLCAAGVRRARPYALVTAGFLLMLVPIALYLAAMPEVYAGFVARYGGTSVDLDVMHHPGAVFSAHLVAARWPIYRSFFEWGFLFERAEAHVMSTTYTTGVFLRAMKVLIPLGIVQILTNRRTPFTLLLLAVFLSAPIAASLIPEKYAIDRALVLVPTGALIGAFGVDWLLMPRIWWAAWPARAVCAALLVWMAVQFNDFYREYQTAYPIRASFWFDGNHPGAFEPIVRQHPPEDPRPVYISTVLPRIRDHWKLYLLAHRRIDLLDHTVFFSQEDTHLDRVDPGTLLLTGADDPVERSFRTMTAVRPVARITEPDGSPSFTIFERTSSAAVFPFDGTYSVEVSVACSQGDARNPCASLPATASCPSMDTITVASGVVLEKCRYLDQAVLTEEGRYVGALTNYGVPIEGTFTTRGTVLLSGRTVSGGNRYAITFRLTKVS